MKSVVLKDLYNMRGNGKSVLISFLILAVAMASTGVGEPPCWCVDDIVKWCAEH